MNILRQARAWRGDHWSFDFCWMLQAAAILPSILTFSTGLLLSEDSLALKHAPGAEAGLRFLESGLLSTNPPMLAYSFSNIAPFPFLPMINISIAAAGKSIRCTIYQGLSYHTSTAKNRKKDNGYWDWRHRWPWSIRPSNKLQLSTANR